MGTILKKNSQICTNFIYFSIGYLILLKQHMNKTKNRGTKTENTFGP